MRRPSFGIWFLVLCVVSSPSSAEEPPRILLREGLQTENIGDSGRVAGTLALLAERLPEANVTLWPWKLSEGERLMLRRAFPRLQIVDGEVDAMGRASSGGLQAAWETSEILISPSKNATTYREWAATGRPFGIFGGAFDPVSDRRTRPLGDTLDGLRQRVAELPAQAFDDRFGSVGLYEKAAFIFCRESTSLNFVRSRKLATPIVEFGPDATFSINVRDESRATRWLTRVGAADRPFLCVVPRLRYTPYYRVRNLARGESDYELDAINREHAEADHRPLRELIAIYVRETGHPVLLCPEMTYEVDVAREHLYEPLPEDVKSRVVWRDTFWLPDEACSVYARSAAVISAECHSPIMALAQGVPTFYVRNPADTTKGEMFRDIGLGDWVFESGATDGRQLWGRLQPLLNNREQAKQQIAAAMQRIEDRQARMVEAIVQAVRDSRQQTGKSRNSLPGSSRE